MLLKMSADELGKKAYQKMITKEFREAVNVLTSAVSKYPKDKRLYANRCYCFIQLREYDK